LGKVEGRGEGRGVLGMGKRQGKERRVGADGLAARGEVRRNKTQPSLNIKKKPKKKNKSYGAQL